MFHVLIITKYNSVSVCTNVVECSTRRKAQEVITSVRLQPKEQLPAGTTVVTIPLFLPGDPNE